MFNLLIALIVIASVLLIVIVLAQNPQGGGLSQGFSSSNQFLGVQSTNNFLNKATWSLVGFVAFASVITAGISISSTDNTSSDSEVIKNVQAEQPASQAPAASKTANPFNAKETK